MPHELWLRLMLRQRQHAQFYNVLAADLHSGGEAGVGARQLCSAEGEGSEGEFRSFEEVDGRQWNLFMFRQSECVSSSALKAYFPLTLLVRRRLKIASLPPAGVVRLAATGRQIHGGPRRRRCKALRQKLRQTFAISRQQFTVHRPAVSGSVFAMRLSRCSRAAGSWALPSTCKAACASQQQTAGCRRLVAAERSWRLGGQHLPRVAAVVGCQEPPEDMYCRRCRCWARCRARR